MCASIGIHIHTWYEYDTSMCPSIDYTHSNRRKLTAQDGVVRMVQTLLADRVAFFAFPSRCRCFPANSCNTVWFREFGCNDKPASVHTLSALLL